MRTIWNKLVYLLVLVPGLYLLRIWDTIPASVPMHFGIDGKPDRYGNKQELLIMVLALSALALIMGLILRNVYRIDPKKYAADNKERLRRISVVFIVFMTALNCYIIYHITHGNSRFDSNLIMGGVGILFAVIGNYLPNLKPNYFAGLRFPWTLENADNWRRTHALAGKMWFAGGLFLAVTCIFLPPVPAFVLFFITMLILVVIPAVYSWKIFRQQKKEQ